MSSSLVIIIVQVQEPNNLIVLINLLLHLLQFSWYITYDKLISLSGLSTNSYYCLCVLTVACVTIPVGALGTCDSTGE